MKTKHLNHSQTIVLVALLIFLCFISTVKADWIWSYEDDFSTQKARKDSYDHSVFWPENAFPPAEPYLYYAYRQGQPAPGLMFMEFQGRTAHLNYGFPLEPLHADIEIQGYLSFDLQFPLNTTDQIDLASSSNTPGRMSYSLSPDGHIWTLPTALRPGHHRIRLASSQGTCYVSFQGAAALIDNLKVSLSGPQGTIIVPIDYRTIQEAIDGAQQGDIIEVLPGIYTGRGNRDIELRGKAITVHSTQGPEQTIIDCQGPAGDVSPRGHRGFYIHQAESSRTRIMGFTIRGGFIPGSDIPPNSMRWNMSPEHPIGAGIYCEFTSPSISNCIITDCGTELGAGIGCVGGGPSIQSCRITGCVAGGFGPCESGGFGGGIGMIRECRANIIDCEITGNCGYWNSYGGGLYCRQSHASLENCEILNNLATGNITGGGAYIGPDSDVMLIHCIIAQNEAYVGGGVFTENDRKTTTTTVYITNCTIAHNRLSGPQMPPFPGGGIHSVNSDIQVRNSIVWYNEGTPIFLLNPPCKSPVVYCDVERGYPGSGNIDKDPLFAPSVSSLQLDYHLQSVVGRFDPYTGTWVKDKRHSPCIDKGNPTDPVGQEPRPHGNRINMGAYGGTRQASKSKTSSGLEYIDEE